MQLEQYYRHRGVVGASQDDSVTADSGEHAAIDHPIV
jgi:hypothetical protein